MKSEDLPRRIVSYEYLEVPVVWKSMAHMYNMYGKDGWRMIERREMITDNYGDHTIKYKYPDGYEINIRGKYEVVIFEREVHEFRSR